TVMAAPRFGLAEKGLSGWLGSRALSGRQWATKNLASPGDERLLPTTRGATPLSVTAVTRTCKRAMDRCHSLYPDTGGRFLETGTYACHLGNGCGPRIGYLPRGNHAGSPFSSQVHSVARTPTGFHRCLSLWGGASCDVLVLIVAGHYGVPAHGFETKLKRVWGRTIRNVKALTPHCNPVQCSHSPYLARVR
ncbi:MAG: hypothetical protein RL022_2824, partial [Chloroflexota bacterium]